MPSQLPVAIPAAPPVKPFCGETVDLMFDDWLPALQRAAEWNQWSDDETLLQLAGHLRGGALQEWSLLRTAEKESLEAAINVLRGRLDPGSRALAAQDFRHASPHEGESVADYIRCLKQLFWRAYGREEMSDETRETLLHSQLQEGLLYKLMKAPAVSGSHAYRELCLAASSEKRLVELAMRRQYQTPQSLASQRDDTSAQPSENVRNLLTCLPAPDSEDNAEVRQVQVHDHSSKQQYARVQLEGVPALGIIDSGSDITIMGGERGPVR